MQNNQKGYALNAYKHAASFNFDANLQEDAAFNHAKLVYEQEATYADAVGVFQNYINTISEVGIFAISARLFSEVLLFI